MQERSPPPSHHEERGHGNETEHLHRLIHSVQTEIQVIAAQLNKLRDLPQAMQRMEEKLTKMPTREQFDAAIQGVKDSVAAEATQVGAKVAALSTTIQELRDLLAGGGQITDADLVALGEISASIGNVLPDDIVPQARRR